MGLPPAPRARLRTCSWLPRTSAFPGCPAGSRRPWCGTGWGAGRGPPTATAEQSLGGPDGRAAQGQDREPLRLSGRREAPSWDCLARPRRCTPGPKSSGAMAARPPQQTAGRREGLPRAPRSSAHPPPARSVTLPPSEAAEPAAARRCQLPSEIAVPLQLGGPRMTPFPPPAASSAAPASCPVPGPGRLQPAGPGLGKLVPGRTMLSAF